MVWRGVLFSGLMRKFVALFAQGLAIRYRQDEVRMRADTEQMMGVKPTSTTANLTAVIVSGKHSASPFLVRSIADRYLVPSTKATSPVWCVGATWHGAMFPVSPPFTNLEFTSPATFDSPRSRDLATINARRRPALPVRVARSGHCTGDELVGVRNAALSNDLGAGERRHALAYLGKSFGLPLGTGPAVSLPQCEAVFAFQPLGPAVTALDLDGSWHETHVIPTEEIVS